MSTVLGNRVLLSRRDLDMKQGELARRIGVSRPYISRIETGNADNITVEVLVKLASVLGVPVSYLVGQTDAPAGLIDDGRRYNPHSLRHAWARRAIQAGMDLGTVSEIMGHTGIEVTARFYARWADRELQERKEAYSRPLPVPAHAGLAGPATGVQSGANRVTIGRQSGA